MVLVDGILISGEEEGQYLPPAGSYHIRFTGKGDFDPFKVLLFTVTA